MNYFNSAMPSSAESLLMEEIGQPGWQHTLAEQKAFFVRGVTWVRQTYLPFASDISKYVQILPEHLSEYAPMLSPIFRWEDTFSPRQALDAISLRNRKPLKFAKAVLTIICCDLAARRVLDARDAVGTVFGKMYIEPAVFYVRDFNTEALLQIMKARPQILEHLRDETNQTSRKVFEEMSRGMTVTKDLALKTLEIIKREMPDAPIGEVDWRPRGPKIGPASEQLIT